MDRNFRLEAERTGRRVAEARRSVRVAGRAGSHGHPRRSADAVVAMLGMPGLSGADIDLSAGMVA